MYALKHSWKGKFRRVGGQSLGITRGGVYFIPCRPYPWIIGRVMASSSTNVHHVETVVPEDNATAQKMAASSPEAASEHTVQEHNRVATEAQQGDDDASTTKSGGDSVLYRLCISNMGNFVKATSFSNFLTKEKVPHFGVQKVVKSVAGFLLFETEEQMKEAESKLGQKQTKYKGKPLRVRNANPLKGSKPRKLLNFAQQPHGDKRIERAGDDGTDLEIATEGSSMHDLLSSWYRWEYPTQLSKKHDMIRELMETLYARTKEATINAFINPSTSKKRGRNSQAVPTPDADVEAKMEKTWIATETADTFKEKLRNIQGSPEIIYYRNKAKFTIGKNSEDEISVGFLTKPFRDGRRVENPIGCLNVSRASASIAHRLESFFKSSAFEPYDCLTHTGVWRAVTVREGCKTGEIMIIVEATPPGSAVGDHQAAAALGNELPVWTRGVKVDETAVHSAISVDSEFAILSNMERDASQKRTSDKHPAPVSNLEELKRQQSLYEQELQQLDELLSQDFEVTKHPPLPSDCPTSTVTSISEKVPATVKIHSAFLQEYSAISGPGKFWFNTLCMVPAKNSCGSLVFYRRKYSLQAFTGTNAFY
eukprot:gb/GECG01016495.1/.p1 GENE.gb/GECG01016495.1/~~gb/GECG01016495.1/.p1  ORF type:complete len:594 (+),score=85.10 gb/GECG01016495.1/:1-1782(+)